MTQNNLPSSEPEKQQESIVPDNIDATEAETLRAEREAAMEAELKEVMEPEAPIPTAPSPEPAPQPAPQPSPRDYKEDYANSTREFQVLNAKTKETQARLDTLINNSAPTEQELRQAYPDWDTFNDVTKSAFREALFARKQSAATQNMVLDIVQKQEWDNEFARTVTANPSLLGKEAEFKQYCLKPSHKNAPMEVLVNSFLFEIKDELPQTPQVPVPKPGLEKGSGGPKTPDNAEMTETEIAHIRANDPTRYRTLIKQGKI